MQHLEPLESFLFEGNPDVDVASEREIQAKAMVQIGVLKKSMSLVDRGNKPDSQKMLDKAKLTQQIAKQYLLVAQSMNKEYMAMMQVAKTMKK